MAYDFNGSTQFLSTGISPISSEPLTMALWFNRKNFAGNVVFVALDRGTNSGTGIHNIGGSTGSSLSAASNDGTISSVTSTNSYTLNTWNHGCSVMSSASSRTIYLNGGGASTSTVTKNVTGLSNVSIGARYANGVVGIYAPALIAEVGIWDTALTDSEIASLARGMTCDKVRPQNLVFYAPLVRDLQDVRGGLTITNNNSATVADHPRVYGRDILV